MKHTVAAALMAVALCWLTVCLPYVYSFQKELAKQEASSAPVGSPIDSEESNPLSNSTEEKAPSTPTEELFHHPDDHNYLFGFKLSHNNGHSYDVYVAFHGEVQCPPPNFIS